MMTLSVTSSGADIPFGTLTDLTFFGPVTRVRRIGTPFQAARKSKLHCNMGMREVPFSVNSWRGSWEQPLTALGQPTEKGTKDL